MIKLMLFLLPFLWRCPCSVSEIGAGESLPVERPKRSDSLTILRV